MPNRLAQGGRERANEAWGERLLSHRNQVGCSIVAMRPLRSLGTDEPWNPFPYSSCRHWTGSSCAARVAGTVPKMIPISDDTATAISTEAGEIGIT